MMKFGCLIFLLLIIYNKHVCAQNDTLSLARTVNTLIKQADAKPVEKVYLHLDKPYYIPGDTVWLKAYVVLGQAHKLSALGSVLYAELINESDSIVSRLILRLDAGLANGDFVIPDTYKPGDYRIRSYTHYMRNFDAGYFFDQPLRIGPLLNAASNEKKANKKNTTSGTNGTTPLANGNTDVRFFPEAGDLVNGVRSKVAVKSVNKNGSGEDVKGTVIDNEGNEVAEFETQHLGMGVFALNPQFGKTYKAKISELVRPSSNL